MSAILEDIEVGLTLRQGARPVVSKANDPVPDNEARYYQYLRLSPENPLDHAFKISNGLRIRAELSRRFKGP